MLNDSQINSIRKRIESIYEQEKDSYNWDFLEFDIYSNDSYEFRRRDYNFYKVPSFPKNRIKEKYYHYKWIPIFSDYGGNFIGMDMDADIEGESGQIIIYGEMKIQIL